MLPLDLDPTAQDARIGDDAKQAAPPCGRRRAAILVAHLGLGRWRRRRKATAEAWGRLRAQLRLLGCTGSSATAARSPRARDVDGGLQAAFLCTKWRGRERAVAVVSDREPGEKERERGGSTATIWSSTTSAVAEREEAPRQQRLCSGDLYSVAPEWFGWRPRIFE